MSGDHALVGGGTLFLSRSLTASRNTPNSAGRRRPKALISRQLSSDTRASVARMPKKRFLPTIPSTMGAASTMQTKPITACTSPRTTDGLVSRCLIAAVREWLLVFRVVGCLPRAEITSEQHRSEGQASDKPQGTKPRAQLRPRPEATSLWRIDRWRAGRRCRSQGLDGVANGVERGGHSADARPQRDESRVACRRRPRWRAWRADTLPMRDEVESAEGTGAVECQSCWPAHAGGARIAWPRSNVSMMVMAAPQCRQTNVGRSGAGSGAAS